MRNIKKHHSHQMNFKYTLVLLLAIFTFGCNPKFGPKIHYYKKDGQLWYTSKIYGYPNGKRKLAQIDTYKKQNDSPESKKYELQETVLFYELWPNNEWKFVSETGFTTFKNGNYYLNMDSVKVPDNVIYKYFDKNFEEHIEVYKDGKRVEYTKSYSDEHQTLQFLRDKPGVYNWKNGKEYFEREFTEQEWENYIKMNEMLKSKSIADSKKTK